MIFIRLQWKSNVLDKIDNKLVGACLNLIEKLRLGEEVTHTQQDQIKKAVGSFRDVRDHKKSKYRTGFLNNLKIFSYFFRLIELKNATEKFFQITFCKPSPGWIYMKKNLSGNF